MEDNSLKWNHYTDKNNFKTKSHQNQASWLDNVTNLKNCFFFARLPLISFLQYNINRTIRLIDALTPSLQFYNIFLFVRSSKYRSFLASSPHLPTFFRIFLIFSHYPLLNTVTLTYYKSYFFCYCIRIARECALFPFRSQSLRTRECLQLWSNECYQKIKYF